MIKEEMAKKIILVLVACFSALFISEIVVRVFHLAPQIISNIGPFRFIDNPKIVYEFIPRSYIDNSVINNQGFKDTDFIKEKAKNLVRIAMIGDSITQGMHVPLGKTFSDQLEIILNQRALEIKSDLKYEVMNFGVGGYNLGAEIETLKTKVIPYQPDIVVLNFFHNDNEPFPGIQMLFMDTPIGDKQRVLLYKKYYSQRNSIWGRFKRGVLHKSGLYNFLFYAINNIDKDKLRLFAFRKLYHNSIVKDEKDAVFYSGLSEIMALKNKLGFHFIICIHPHLLNGEHPNNKKFSEAAQAFHLPCFHMFEYYVKENIPPKSIQINKDDVCHPNELGHLIIAKAIFTELKKYGFIDRNL